MNSFLFIKTSIEYVHIPLKRRPGFIQNEGKTNPALITTQVRNLASILVHFETPFGSKFPSETEF